MKLKSEASFEFMTLVQPLKDLTMEQFGLETFLSRVTISEALHLASADANYFFLSFRV